MIMIIKKGNAAAKNLKTGNTKDHRIQKRRGKFAQLIALAALTCAVVLSLNMTGSSLLASGASSASLASPPILPDTIPLQRTDMTRSVSLSGVVESGSVTNIYSTLTYPVRKIYANVGDWVYEGDVLATLDTANLQNDIAQAELNYKNAAASADEEARASGNSIVNARTQLESSQISLERQALSTAKAENDLLDAQVESDKPFDGYTYDNAIKDAGVALSRKKEDLEKAQADLEEAIENFDDYSYQNAIRDAEILLERKLDDLGKAESDLEEALNDFDDYTYQNTIRDMRIALERKQDDFDAAAKELKDEKNSTIEPFDEYSFQNKIDDAQRAYNQKVSDYYKASNDCDNAWNDYIQADSNPEVPSEAVSAALSKVESTRAARDAAGKAIDEAAIAHERAIDDMERARSDHYKIENDTMENTVNAAQKTYDAAQNALEDAERNCEKALSDLDRAKDDAALVASDKLKTAQNAAADAQIAYEKALMELERAKENAISNAEESLSKAADAAADAQRAYEKAAADKSRAAGDYSENNEKQLKNAQNALADSQKLLQSSNNSLASARSSLEQAEAKPLPSDTSIRLQELNLEKLNTQLAQGEIIATASGVITESNIKVGASPSGILFVIEDTQDLYISARVKEYNLASVALGMRTIITTEAAEDAIYEAEVAYISPKAVSEAGSTSVEFEIRAKLLAPDDAIKIGMNSFIDVIVEAKHDIYAVPISLVVTNEAGSFVYALASDEILEIPISTGLKTYTDVEIFSEALYDGMQILSDPLNRLSPGGSGSGGGGGRGASMFPFGGGRT